MVCHGQARLQMAICRGIFAASAERPGLVSNRSFGRSSMERGWRVAAAKDDEWPLSQHELPQNSGEYSFGAKAPGIYELSIFRGEKEARGDQIMIDGVALWLAVLFCVGVVWLFGLVLRFASLASWRLITEALKALVREPNEKTGTTP